MAPCFFLLGCTTTPDINTSLLHKREFQLSVNDQKINGVGIVNRKSNYRIRFSLKKKLARLAMVNCHRELIWRNIQALDYYLIPVMFLENENSCLLKIQALDEKGVSHDAIIDFTAGEQLEADIYCNAEKETHKGASICQGRKGTYQVVWFKEKVSVKHPERCPAPESKGGYQWKIQLASNLCIYKFISASGSVHRYTTFGYDTMRVDYEY